MLSCHNSKPIPISVGIGLKANDPGFLALKDTAQKHIGLFIDSIKMHKSDTNYIFTIKSDFVDGDIHEHMWSQVNKYNGEKFLGIFADSAYQVHNIKPKDPVKIKETDVEDWIIYDKLHDNVTGNFSEDYLRSKIKISDEKK